MRKIILKTMDASERIEKQKALVEYIGRMQEKEGYQPVAGRILGLLMVMDKEEFTFEEIVDEVKISKSSASVALRNLELRGVIEYVTYPGDRKKYYRLSTMDLESTLNEIEKKVIRSMDLIEQIIELKEDKNSRSVDFMRKVSKGMVFFLNHMKKFKKTYEPNMLL
ncbi:MAG: hypothetical protein PHS48_07535 [Bacteroidales bacterium]|nr:hypothetical protein [Bacteroidales bacterium]